MRCDEPVDIGKRHVAPEVRTVVRFPDRVTHLEAAGHLGSVGRVGAPILVGHSFGGASCLKYLEANLPASGAVLVCSVPPSGNGPMVGRFLRRSLKQAWLITTGFAMKRAATDAQDARWLPYRPCSGRVHSV